MAQSQPENPARSRPRSLKRDCADVAAHWIERLTAGDATPGEVAELRAWLAADPANRAAYEQARTLWAVLPDTSLPRHRRAPLRLVGGAVLAAALAALLVVPGQHDRATAVGEVRRLALPDGSVAWLDSDSAIDLAFDARARTVTLARGRMAVAVARDPARPFAVRAGDATITDVGTRFVVDRADGLRVAVEQGTVEVAGAGAPFRLGAGEAARLGGATRTRRLARPGEFAWRDGRILLDRVPLADALAEIDRYRAGRIVLLDPGLAARRVSGTLFADRVDEGLAALARSQGLTVTRLPWLAIVRRGD